MRRSDGSKSRILDAQSPRRRVQAKMKHWVYLAAAGLLGWFSPGCSKQSTAPAQPSGPNQALFKYLGNPVATPANLDAAYTAEGLTRALHAAGETAGISLARVEIDDSEFPFLAGVVCAHDGDLEKLKEAIRSMPAYNFSGGVSSGVSYVMNLVPSTAFPIDGRDRIYRRMAVRERMLFDRITGHR